MLYAVYTVTCIHESDFTADGKYTVQTRRAILENNLHVVLNMQNNFYFTG